MTLTSVSVVTLTLDVKLISIPRWQRWLDIIPMSTRVVLLSGGLYWCVLGIVSIMLLYLGAGLLLATTSHMRKMPGGSLRNFLTGVCRPQNDKPTLIYGKYAEKTYPYLRNLIWNRPLSTENTQIFLLLEGHFTTFRAFRPDNRQFLSVQTDNLQNFSPLLRSFIQMRPFATDFG